MPRFVLLYHDCPPGYDRSSHWDLMLEAGGKLRTWALFQLPIVWHAAHAATMLAHPNCPPLASDNSVVAERLADHRPDYLHEEGPLGGDRGEVRRIDQGTYESVRETAVQWEVEVSGALVNGCVKLTSVEISIE